MRQLAIVIVLSVAPLSTAYAADEGFYGGITGGQSKTGKVDDATGISMSKNSDMVAGVLMGYQFNTYLGVEGFYTGAGKYKTTDGSTDYKGKVDAFGVNLVGSAPISPMVGVFGKLGIADAKNTYNGLSVSRAATTYGLGGYYKLTNSVEARLGWDHYAAKTDLNGGVEKKFNAGVYSLGLVARF